MTTTRLIRLLLVAVLLTQVVPAQETVRRRVDILTLRFLLSNDLFDHLQRRMDMYQASFERNGALDEDIHRAVRAFVVNDPRMRRQLDAWIARYPGSAPAYASRGALYLTLGVALSRAQKYEEAKSLLQQASEDIRKAGELNERFAESQTLQIEMLMNFGDTTNVRTELDKALETHSRAFHLRRVYLWNLAPHLNPGKEQELRRVIAGASEFVTSNPRLQVLSGFPDLFRGRAAQGAGDHQAAIRYFSNALSYGPYYQFSFFRGISHEAVGNYLDALRDYDDALSDSWQSVDIVRAKARVLRFLERTADADRYEAYAEQLTSFVVPVRGGVLSSSSIVEIPVDTIGSAVVRPVERTPDTPLAQESPETRPEIEELTARLEADPDNAALWFERGMTYLELKEYGNAEKDLLHTIGLDMQHASAHYNLGWIYLHHGMYDAGIERNTEVIRLRKNFGRAYMNRAFGLRMLGRIDEAMPDLQRACRLGVREACTLLRIANEKSTEKDGGADTHMETDTNSGGI